jgi:hypothetical protein
MSEAMNRASSTSIVGAAPEITAPVRLEGQSHSEVLFAWLIVNRFLWMIEAPHDTNLRKIMGTSMEIDLIYQLGKWKRKQPERGQGHKALTAPEDEATRHQAFARLERLKKVHLLDSGGSGRG